MVVLPAQNDLTPDNVNSGMEGFTSIARPDLSTLFGDGSVEQGVSRRRLSSSNAMMEESLGQSRT